MCLCYNCCGDEQQFSPHLFPWLQNPHACPEQGQCCHLLVASHPHELGKASGPSRVGRGSETLTLTCKPFGLCFLRQSQSDETEAEEQCGGGGPRATDGTRQGGGPRARDGTKQGARWWFEDKDAPVVDCSLVLHSLLPN